MNEKKLHLKLSVGYKTWIFNHIILTKYTLSVLQEVGLDFQKMKGWKFDAMLHEGLPIWDPSIEKAKYVAWWSDLTPRITSKQTGI